MAFNVKCDISAKPSVALPAALYKMWQGQPAMTIPLRYCFQTGTK